MMSSSGVKSSEPCRVCGAQSEFAFEGELLRRTVRYFDCSVCGYLETEAPTWLDEAYSSPINITDTGILARNALNARRVGALAILLGIGNPKVVDFAGGHGILVRMLRDTGIDARWSDKYCENLFARGFEHRNDSADIATAFEAFEHFTEPLAELERILAAAPVVLLSTELLPEPVPRPGTWWYYGEEHGQHIGIYRRRTMQWMADKLGASFATNGSNTHVFARPGRTIDFGKLRWIMRAWPVLRLVRRRSLIQADHAELSARQDARIS
jgi:hypothetical protein